MDAMLELQAAHLLPESVVTSEDLVTARAAFVATFASSHSYISWVGCDRVVDGLSACTGPEGFKFRRPVDIGFTPVLAMAALLDMHGEGPEKALQRLAPVRVPALPASNIHPTGSPLHPDDW